VNTKSIILRFFSFSFVFFFALNSCIPYEKLMYTHQTEAKDEISLFNEREGKKIAPFDNLNISIYSLDPQVAGLFTIRDNNNLDIRLKSYEVSKEGFVTLPFIGPVEVANLSIEDARLKIENEMNTYLNDISVLVRFVGNRVTVLGEVRRQGEYNFYDDKVSIFQALSFANGIADFGNHEEITIIREVNGSFSYHSLDLTDRFIVESDYYYLLPNDVIIVNPIRAKYRYLRDYALLSTIFSTVTTAILIVNFISNNPF